MGRTLPTGLAVALAMLTAGAGWAADEAGGGTAFTDIVSEVRVGVLAHDYGPFSSNKEDGVDGNLEILFASPAFLDLVLSPRPHIGGSVNSSGDTSQAYLGLTWEFDVLDAVFIDLTFGGAVHNGNLNDDELGRKDLGCRTLFRGAIGVGYRITPNHNIAIQLDHISNAKLCDRNEGLETVGVRYGYRF